MKRHVVAILLMISATAFAQAADKDNVDGKEVVVINTPGVAVINDLNSPVPVTVVDQKEYIQLHDVTLIPVGDNGFGVFGFGKTIYTVPGGKRLIIETVSPFVSDLAGVNYDVSLTVGNTATGLSFALQTKGVFAAGSIPEKGRDSLTLSAKLVVGPGIDLRYQMIRDVSSSPEVAGTSITVVGYLENAM